MNFIDIVGSSRTKKFGKTMLTVAACLALGLGVANAAGGNGVAGGGTAKPPGGNSGNSVTPPNGAGDPSVPNPEPISFNGNTNPPVVVTTKGFEVVGLFQSATLDGGNCPGLPPTQWGGTAVLNGVTITIPCNTILQMPANTLSWSDLFTLPTAQAALTLDGTPPPVAPVPAFTYPSTEFRVAGNIVGGVPIAGLIYISQHSLASGNGFISHIDYATGAIYVGDFLGGPDVARLIINDQAGRFGRAQAPDPRFNVDDQNPTITTSTGYPMCVPRTDPAVADDTLCPQINRPLGTSPACRNFAGAGIAGVGGNRGIDLMLFSTSQQFDPGKVFCTGFVMKYTPGTPLNSITLPRATSASPIVKVPTSPAQVSDGVTEPDANKQAPFEPGDLITYSGALLKGSADGPPNAAGIPSDTISIHTIEANVAIFTAPSSLPSYVKIGDFRMSSDSQAAIVSVTGIPQEVQDRMVLESVVTDVTSTVDIYMADIEPTPSGAYPQRYRNAAGDIVLPTDPGATPIPPGAITYRWLTPFSMTGEPGILGSNAATNGNLPIDGGITTQFTGPLPGRAHIRATKANVGILVSPSRYVRVVIRSVCDPANINRNDMPSIVNNVPVPGSSGPCVERANAANGLNTGQYLAPQFGLIFPEHIMPGDPVVPYDFWNLPFLVNGEGGSGGSLDTLQPAQLVPTPW